MNSWLRCQGWSKRPKSSYSLMRTRCDAKNAILVDQLPLAIFDIRCVQQLLAIGFFLIFSTHLHTAQHWKKAPLVHRWWQLFNKSTRFFFPNYVVFIRQMCQCNIFCAAFLISNMLFACCALVTVRHDASTCILNTTSSTQGLISLTDRHWRILTDRYFLGFPGRTRHMENQRHWWSVPLLDPTWSIMILLLILCLRLQVEKTSLWLLLPRCQRL